MPVPTHSITSLVPADHGGIVPTYSAQYTTLQAGFMPGAKAHLNHGLVMADRERTGREARAS
jgi:hypothetical protein